VLGLFVWLGMSLIGGGSETDTIGNAETVSVAQREAERLAAEKSAEEKAAEDGHAQTKFEIVKAEAEQGAADAQHWLGENGSMNDAEAVKWFRLAAEQGHAGSLHNLGVVYSGRVPALKDKAEAVKWFRKSTEKGSVDAQYELGKMYRDGEGVPEDDVESYAWFSVAVANGNGIARISLGIAQAELTPEQLAAAQKRAMDLFEQINANKVK
jgi:TPR repeat protein